MSPKVYHNTGNCELCGDEVGRRFECGRCGWRLCEGCYFDGEDRDQSQEEEFCCECQ